MPSAAEGTMPMSGRMSGIAAMREHNALSALSIFAVLLRSAEPVLRFGDVSRCTRKTRGHPFAPLMAHKRGWGQKCASSREPRYSPHASDNFSRPKFFPTSKLEV